MESPIVAFVARPAASTVDPNLLFEATLKIRRGREVPLTVELEVRTADRKYLGMASVRTLGGDTLPLYARDGEETDQLLELQFLLPVTKTVIDYIDVLRWKDGTGNVILECRFDIQWLVAGGGATPLESVADRRGGAKDGTGPFLERRATRHPTTLMITSGEWQNEAALLWERL